MRTEHLTGCTYYIDGNCNCHFASGVGSVSTVPITPTEQKIQQLAEEIHQLKEAIRDSEAYGDGFCVVCNNHTDRHDEDCLMKGM